MGLNRRDFIKGSVLGLAAATTAGMTGCASKGEADLATTGTPTYPGILTEEDIKIIEVMIFG